MHWTLDQLWAIPTSYYETLGEMLQEEARDRERR